MECDIRFKVISPDDLVYEGLVKSLVLPGTDGLFGVLSGHAPLLAGLAPGVARFTECGGGGERRMALAGGFCEVLDNRVNLVVGAAELAGKIDLPRAEAALERAHQRLHGDRGETVDRARAETALFRALARIKAAGSRR